MFHLNDYPAINIFDRRLSIELICLSISHNQHHSNQRTTRVARKPWLIVYIWYVIEIVSIDLVPQLTCICHKLWSKTDPFLMKNNFRFYSKSKEQPSFHLRPLFVMMRAVALIIFQMNVLRKNYRTYIVNVMLMPVNNLRPEIW